MADSRNFFKQALRFIMWLSEGELGDDDHSPLWWCRFCERRKKTYYAVWTFRHDGVIITGENVMAVLNVGQLVDASVAFKNKDGGPANAQAGSVVWSSSDESVATVTVDPADETKAKIKGVSGVGVDGQSNPAAVIECQADGDPDEAVRELISTAAVSVTDPDAGEAYFSEITLGEPYDAPAEGEGPHPDQTLPGDLESPSGGGGSGDENA